MTDNCFRFETLAPLRRQEADGDGIGHGQLVQDCTHLVGPRPGGSNFSSPVRPVRQEILKRFVASVSTDLRSQALLLDRLCRPLRRDVKVVGVDRVDPQGLRIDFALEVLIM